MDFYRKDCMGAKAANRRMSFRYTLRNEDKRSGRVSRSLLQPREVFRVKVYDLSAGGLSFFVDQSYAPLIGERVSLEFVIPTGRQMAWYGEVVRLENVGATDDLNPDWESPVKVGVKFTELPKLVQEYIDSRLTHANSEYRNVVPISEEFITIEIQRPMSLLAKVSLTVTVLLALILGAYGFSESLERMKKLVNPTGDPSVLFFESNPNSPADSTKKTRD